MVSYVIVIWIKLTERQQNWGANDFLPLFSLSCVDFNVASESESQPTKLSLSPFFRFFCNLTFSSKHCFIFHWLFWTLLLLPPFFFFFPFRATLDHFSFHVILTSPHTFVLSHYYIKKKKMEGHNSIMLQLAPWLYYFHKSSMI